MMRHLIAINYDATYEDQIAQVDAMVESITALDKELSIMDMKVFPYGQALPLRNIVDRLREWKGYTVFSRFTLIKEINGCIPVINTKIDLAGESDVTVMIMEGPHKGEIRIYKESLAREFVEDGYAEYHM